MRLDFRKKYREAQYVISHPICFNKIDFFLLVYLTCFLYGMGWPASFSLTNKGAVNRY